jgi:hypothetical protein
VISRHECVLEDKEKGKASLTCVKITILDEARAALTRMPIGAYVRDAALQ